MITRDTDDFNHGPKKILAQLEPHLEPVGDCLVYTGRERVVLPLRASGGLEASIQPSRAAWLAANPTGRLTADEFAVHAHWCDNPGRGKRVCCNPDHLIKGDEETKRTHEATRAQRQKDAARKVAA